MKAIFTLLICFSTISSMGQFSFLGFNQSTCGFLSSHAYTDSTIRCGSHGYGYALLHNGSVVYQKCMSFGSYTMDDLFFINNTDGLIVETSSQIGTQVFQTLNSGLSRTALLGGGPPGYLAYFPLNFNEGYLLCYLNVSPALYIVKISDRKSKLVVDNTLQGMTLNDTLDYPSFCNLDTLSFRISNQSNTYTYQIALQQPTVGLDESNKLKPILYPNPAMDILHIEYANSHHKVSYELREPNGRLLAGGTVKDQKISLVDLPQGLYLLSTIVDGQRHTNKLVKQ